jgi:hypothetical protein
MTGATWLGTSPESNSYPASEFLPRNRQTLDSARRPHSALRNMAIQRCPDGSRAVYGNHQPGPVLIGNCKSAGLRSQTPMNQAESKPGSDGIPFG